MNILLNTTAHELEFVGGDQSYYKTLIEFANNPRFGKGVETNILSHSSQVWRNRARLLETISNQVSYPTLKRRLFAEGRRVPITQQDLDASRADVVFSTILVARLPSNANVANVFYSQGINSSEYYNYVGDKTLADIADYYNRISRRITLMVVGTRDGLARLHNLCPALKCETVHIPQLVLLDPVSEPPHLSPDMPVKLLFIGRDYIRKGLADVIDVVRSLVGLFELHILTVANCPLASSVSDLPNVYWHSDVSNAEVQKMYRNSHVLVVPTYADTYNLVLVEAMAFGCAVLTSNLPPLDEIAPSGVVGACVPRGDRNALLRALQNFVSDRDHLAQMRAGALQHYLTHYAPEYIVPQLLNAFKVALELVK